MEDGGDHVHGTSKLTRDVGFSDSRQRCGHRYAVCAVGLMSQCRWRAFAGWTLSRRLRRKILCVFHGHVLRCVRFFCDSLYVKLRGRGVSALRLVKLCLCVLVIGETPRLCLILVPGCTEYIVGEVGARLGLLMVSLRRWQRWSQGFGKVGQEYQIQHQGHCIFTCCTWGHEVQGKMCK